MNSAEIGQLTTPPSEKKPTDNAEISQKYKKLPNLKQKQPKNCENQQNCLKYICIDQKIFKKDMN
jgi:hypothetical protein